MTVIFHADKHPHFVLWPFFFHSCVFMARDWIPQTKIKNILRTWWWNITEKKTTTLVKLCAICLRGGQTRTLCWIFVVPLFRIQVLSRLTLEIDYLFYSKSLLDIWRKPALQGSYTIWRSRNKTPKYPLLKPLCSRKAKHQIKSNLTRHPCQFTVSYTQSGFPFLCPN